MTELLVILAMGAAGLTLWRVLSPGLDPLQDEDTNRHALTLFLGAFFLQALLQQFSLQLLTGDGRLEIHELKLVDIVTSQALSGGAVVLAMLLVVTLSGARGASIGLRRHEGPPAVLLAVAAWLIYAPLGSVAAWLNRAFVEGVLGEDDHVVQSHMQRFLEQDGASTDPTVWLCIVVAIPIVEEVLFRGALYGGMRKMMPPGFAIVLSGVLFGAMHDPIAMLPVATLGMALAWLYERTGSLVAPCLAHALQNGLTLTLAVYFPEAI